MALRVTRRDFLNGVAIGAGTSLLAPSDLFAQVGPTAATPGGRSLDGRRHRSRVASNDRTDTPRSSFLNTSF